MWESMVCGCFNLAARLENTTRKYTIRDGKYRESEMLGFLGDFKLGEEEMAPFK